MPANAHPELRRRSRGEGRGLQQADQGLSVPSTERADQHRQVDFSGKAINTIAPFDDTYFDALNGIIQEENVMSRDLAAMELLRELDIEKDVSLPSSETRAHLSRLAKKVQAELIDMVLNNPDKFWDGVLGVPRGSRGRRRNGLHVQVSMRPGLRDPSSDLPRCDHLVVNYGDETNYFVGGVDSEGKYLSGENTYRLDVPANAPVYHFWSAMVYDDETVSCAKDMPKAGVSSSDAGLVTNPDGSTDVHFAPEPPEGLGANWAPTKPGVDYFLLFRFYGVEPHLYEGAWQLSDLVKVDG